MSGPRSASWTRARRLDDAQLATTVPDVRLDPRHAPPPRRWRRLLSRTSCAAASRSPSTRSASDIPTLRAVMEAHDPVWQRLVAGDLDPAIDVVEYEDGGYETHAPLGIRLAQALYHGTDHRSQVCTALTALGIEPPAIEVWDLAREDGRMFTIETRGAPTRRLSRGSRPGGRMDCRRTAPSGHAGDRTQSSDRPTRAPRRFPQCLDPPGRSRARLPGRSASSWSSHARS